MKPSQIFALLSVPALFLLARVLPAQQPAESSGLNAQLLTAAQREILQQFDHYCSR